MRKISISVLLSVVLLTVTLSMDVHAGDTWPFEGDSTQGVNQPSVHGYTSGQIMEWSPETDPYAPYLRSFVPLQQRNEAFAPTQANPELNNDVQVLNLAGDYGNAFIENAPYTNKFAQYHFGFWQYIDYYSYWHGTATAYTPSQYYDDTAQQDWQQKWFEFGCLNIPNPTYTDAAHKNGVQSLACIFFSNNDRGQQTYKQMLVKDAMGQFPVADKLIEMAQYYGYDGYFFNQEESGPDVEVSDIEDYMSFMNVLKEGGLYVHWYDAVNTSTGANSFARSFQESNVDWLYNRDKDEVVSDSFFFDYGVGSSGIAASINMLESLNASEGTNYDIYSTGFAGLEAGRDRFSSSQGLALASKLDSNGIPGMSIAILGTDFVHAGLDEDRGDGWPTKRRAENGYQWMTTLREQLWWSGPNVDPTNTITSSQNTVADVSADNRYWPGMSSVVTEKSVIGGSGFYTNFNTGHGLYYYVDGQVSNEEEWSNMSLQDIPVTWQWWQETQGVELTVDYDYGNEYTMEENVNDRYNYTHIGGYNGGSSLALAGTLNQENYIRLYKSDLMIEEGSNLSVVYNKVSGSDDSQMSIGLIFKDEPTQVEKIEVPNSGDQSNGWVLETVDVSDYAGREVATIGIVVESPDTQSNYQMNIGEIRISEASSDLLVGPDHLEIEALLPNTNEMFLKWEKQDYAEVEAYHVYVNDTFVGGKYDEVFYIKNLPSDSGVVKVVPVDKNGFEGLGSMINYDMNDIVSNIGVDSKEDGVIDLTWSKPVTVNGIVNIAIETYNVPENEKISVVKQVDINDGSASFEEMPIDGQNYRLTFTSSNGGCATYDGTFIDKVCDVYAEDYSIVGDTINLPMPNTKDWRYMYVYEDGVAKSFPVTYLSTTYPKIIRGRTKKSCLSFTSQADRIAVVMEDYAGNLSEKLYIKNIEGIVSYTPMGSGKKDMPLSITFASEVQKGVGTIQIIKTEDGTVVQSIDVSSASVVIDGLVVTINHDVLEENTQYCVLVESGAFKEMDGNAIEGVTSQEEWVYTTAEGYSALDLTTYFNIDGVSYESDMYDGDIDNARSTYCADLIDDEIPYDYNGISFTFGSFASEALNMIASSGQTIDLNDMVLSDVYLLASATNGDQQGDITIVYADGESQVISMVVSDWCSSNTDQAAIMMNHRHINGSIQQINCHIDGLQLGIKEKAIDKIILPYNEDLKIMAISYLE